MEGGQNPKLEILVENGFWRVGSSFQGGEMTFRKIHLCAFAAVAMLVAVGCQSTPGPAAKKDTAADKAAINALRDKVTAAFNSNDAAAVAACYTDDAVMMNPNEASAEGKTAIQASYQATFQQGASKIALTPRETEMAGDWAFETGSASITITPKAVPKKVARKRLAKRSGQPVEMTSRYVVVFKKQADGSWKVHLDIGNSATTPRPVRRAKKR
jgi:uncharacterized protein (TIGR02246 family)